MKQYKIKTEEITHNLFFQKNNLCQKNFKILEKLARKILSKPE